MKLRPDELSLRRRLLGGETVYGLVIKAPAPALVEMCAAAGFDFDFIDGEHGGGEALELEQAKRLAVSIVVDPARGTKLQNQLFVTPAKEIEPRPPDSETTTTRSNVVTPSSALERSAGRFLGCITSVNGF